MTQVPKLFLASFSLREHVVLVLTAGSPTYVMMARKLLANPVADAPVARRGPTVPHYLCELADVEANQRSIPRKKVHNLQRRLLARSVWIVL